MKYCIHCGASLSDEAVICPKCGSGVDYGAPQGQTYNQTQSQPRPQPQFVQSGADRYSTMSIVGFILVFFSEIAGLIVSVLANNEARRAGSAKSSALARAGIIIGIVKLGIAAVALLILLVCFIAALCGASAMPID